VKSDRFSVISFPPPFKFGLVKKYNNGLKKVIDNGSKYVFILQNNIELNSLNLLEELVLYAEKNKECAVVGPTVINGEGNVCWGEGIKKIRMGHEFNVSESFMIRTDWLVKYGLWNSKMIYYGEEMDFFCRVKDSGYTTYVLGNVSLIHFGGGTSSSFQNETDYYRPKSSIFVMKHYLRYR
jgi:GT2 family glycosyltransferase